MTNFSDMLSKAKAMQEKMKEAQDQIKKIEIEGEAGGNLVKVILSGDYELKSITISDAAKKESQEIINDLIIAAYHDQGLIPFKTLSFGMGVNYTSGLEKIRTSPDHGTAYSIAGKGVASIDSFLCSIYLAIDIFRQRMIYDEFSKNKLETSQ